MTTKQLLLHQTGLAFDRRPEMSLLASLKDVTLPEAAWRIDVNALPTIEHLVRHVAWAKSTYCAEAFGKPMPVDDRNCNSAGDVPELSEEFPCGAGWATTQCPGIDGAIALLHRAHRT